MKAIKQDNVFSSTGSVYLRFLTKLFGHLIYCKYLRQTQMDLSTGQRDLCFTEVVF